MRAVTVADLIEQLKKLPGDLQVVGTFDEHERPKSKMSIVVVHGVRQLDLGSVRDRESNQAIANMDGGQQMAVLELDAGA